MTERQLTSQNGLIQKSLKGTKYRWERRNDSKGKHDAPRYYDGVIWVKNRNVGFPTEVKVDTWELTDNENKRFKELTCENDIKCLLINYKNKVWGIAIYTTNELWIAHNSEKLEECLDIICRDLRL